MKLTSIESLKLYLEKEDDTHDELLDSIIDQVSARIETALNRELTKMERNQYFEGGKRYYYLCAYPIDITEPVVVEINGDIKTLDSDYYVWEKEGLIHFVYVTADNVPKNVNITWTGGYEEIYGVLDVPYDLKRACLMESAFEFRRRFDGGLSGVSMQSGSISVNQPSSLLPEVIETIKSYRKYPYG